MSPFAGYDDFDACVRDNQDADDPEAYCAAIKEEVEGEAALSDAERKALEESDCPDGHVSINDQCVPVEEVDIVPPTNLSLPSPYHLAEFQPDKIERIQEGENTVRYTSIKLIGPGRWTDSESRQQVWYSPEGMKNLEVDPDNAIHIFHDSENEVSKAGHIDPESVENADNGVFADLVFDTSTEAGAFADTNMQATLESGGAKGFGGPSVEIPPEGQRVEFNDSEGLPELKGGRISDLGLVKHPGSKDVHFARQTAQTAVALSNGQSDKAPYMKRLGMRDATLGADALLEALDLEADELELGEDRELADVPVMELVGLIAESYDADPADLMDALDPFLGGEEEANMEEDEEGEEENDEEEEEGDEVDINMEEEFAALEERISALEDMVDSMAQGEELEELADAEELEDAKEELESQLADAEKRLEALEEEPEKPRTLSGENGNGEGDVSGRISPIETRRRSY